MNKKKIGIIIIIGFALLAAILIGNAFQATEYVAPEPQTDCTLQENFYSVECIKRFTDPIAESRAFYEEANKNRIEAERIEAEAKGFLDADLEAYNQVYQTVNDKG